MLFSIDGWRNSARTRYTTYTVNCAYSFISLVFLSFARPRWRPVRSLLHLYLLFPPKTQPLRRLRLCYCWFELTKNTIHNKCSGFFSRRIYIPASFIDPKNPFWPKFQTEENPSDPSPVIKIWVEPLGVSFDFTEFISIYKQWLAVVAKYFLVQCSTISLTSFDIKLSVIWKSQVINLTEQFTITVNAFVWQQFHITIEPLRYKLCQQLYNNSFGSHCCQLCTATQLHIQAQIKILHQLGWSDKWYITIVSNERKNVLMGLLFL